MTAHRDLKSIIRARQKKTGESYTTARAHVMRDRAVLLGTDGDASASADVMPAGRTDAVVLKVNDRSARVRILGEEQQVTFRSGDVWNVVPGHLVTLIVDRRWRWRGDAYASGTVEHARIDVARLGLEPLRLHGGGLRDLAMTSEPIEDPDPYAPLWRTLTAQPRPEFEFDGIAWGALPGFDPEENPVCDAAELAAAGDREDARELLMEVLGEDLRCIDAHGHLGNLAFDRSPAQAIVHYEMGVRIGELSLPAGFDGLLSWSALYNRPFLRCLHGHALCQWRLGRPAQARDTFERILAFNPVDNQGARFCWDDVRHGRSWEDVQAREAEHNGFQN